ncbi:histidine kinase dimerization/phospho-acceptor domain-containing protein [Paenibacillus aurantius]|uniref:histidine kinase n=1 Tax=Paenibacillus aurantius TaxID=2918900 RepID=A0AA96LAK8_9BACL|nr:histidine kinase dimerization/phospho-acceptor domain-containing protein [Paenibacillus aurantius]WNQ10087.1 histidine kinase dimerization/phospho-acceptor domain-containing protein [Paenibacillus aurantius]
MESHAEWHSEIAKLRETVRQLSDRVIRFQEQEDRLLSELSEMNNELITVQRMLAKTNLDLKKSQKKAVEAELAKGSFLSMMSHEVRSPMNGILGMTELLMHAELHAEHRKKVMLIEESAKLLLTIVNDILDITKIETGEVKLNEEPFDLRKLLHHMVELMKPNAASRTILLPVWDSRIHPILIGDAVRIRQILLNVIIHSTRLSGSGTLTVRALLERAEKGKQAIRIEVSEPAGERRPLPAPSGQEGSHLGVRIASRLLQLMGGSLNVHGEDGKGPLVSFQLTLPEARAEGSRTGLYGEGPEEASPFALRLTEWFDEETRSLPILLAVDNAINRQVVHMQLTRMGFSQVDVVQDGESAVQRYARRTYSLIVMDHLLPTAHGLEPAKLIREESARRKQPPAPMVCISANPGPDFTAHYRESGFDDCMALPITLEQLEAMLLRWLPAEGPAPSRVLSLPIIQDLKKLDESGVLLRSLLNQFKQMAPGLMDRMKHSVRDKDAAELQKTAYMLKSSALGLGLVSLSATFSQLESMGVAGVVTPEAEALLAGLWEDYEAACRALEQYL